jgi:serine/threonine protein phosphatase PrpC
MSNTNLRHAAITHPGKVRENNEDAYICFESPNGSVYVVCDGVGGHYGGEIASRLATECLQKNLTEKIYPTPFEALTSAIVFANQEIRKASQEAGLLPDFGMGSTIVAVLYQNDAFYLAHMGDSRCYLFDQKQLIRLTKDHTRLQELIDEGWPAPANPRNHPEAHALTLCLGIREDVAPEIRSEPLRLAKKDLLLLCTDGLTNMLTEEQILNILLVPGQDIEKQVHILVNQANEEGGEDNITVILIERQ